jgi:hypothetical protein
MPVNLAASSPGRQEKLGKRFAVAHWMDRAEEERPQTSLSGRIDRVAAPAEKQG